MKLICILFFIILFTCNLSSQDLPTDRQVIDTVETFAVFVSQYTPIDSLYSIQTSLQEIGYAISFEDIVIDSGGLLESMNCSFSNVCQEDWETDSPINFGDSYKLGIIFLSADCSQGAFQTSLNKPNPLLGFMFPDPSGPTHYWNIIGDVPNVAMDEFRANHLVWETE